MEFPADLKYASSDEWVLLDGDRAVIGITDYAQHELGEVVYLELPAVGDNVKKGAAFGVVESVKAVSDLNSPVTGTVVEVNEPLLDEPAGINASPYENGWLILVQMADKSELDDLMDAEKYATYRS